MGKVPSVDQSYVVDPHEKPHVLVVGTGTVGGRGEVSTLYDCCWMEVLLLLFFFSLLFFWGGGGGRGWVGWGGQFRCDDHSHDSDKKFFVLPWFSSSVCPIRAWFSHTTLCLC